MVVSQLMGHLGGERISLDSDAAAHVAARPDSEAPVAAWSHDDRRARRQRSSPQEPSLWAHRGIIESSLGLSDVARAHLQKSLEMDPGESPW